MKSLALVCFGRLKTPGFDQAVAEFSKRLGRYCDFKAYELKPLAVDEKSDAVRARVTGREAETVRELLSSKSFQAAHGRSPALYCLDESGKARSTVEWSQLLSREWDASRTPVFLIGSGLGLDDTLLKQANGVLSFGPQTLSHELARLVLAEQLYRAASYLEGHPYHNEG